MQKISLKDHIYNQLDHARQHLELVFHRFLAAERPYGPLTIEINGREIEPFDPFHSNHRATQRQPVETIQIEGVGVVVEPFVLPHHKKVSKAEWEQYAGEGGYLKNQGFYVYRSGRLIIHGTWFRLLKQFQMTKLARVKIDMPTELDPLWKIDVKKASASPPLVVRQRLSTIIDSIAGAYNRVYTHKGARIRDGHTTHLWSRRVNKNQIFYEINREHPLVSGFVETLNEHQFKQLEVLLGSVEKTLPWTRCSPMSRMNPRSSAPPALTKTR